MTTTTTRRVALVNPDQGDLLTLLEVPTSTPDGSSSRRSRPVSEGVGAGPGVADDVALTETLTIAVPLWMAQLHALSPQSRQRRIDSWAADAAEVVAYHGDLLVFRTEPRQLRESQITPESRRRPGTEVSTTETCNHLARGLAALAYSPGGVSFGGLHWCVAAECPRCRPPRPQETASRAELYAELERIDADFRALTGMPPWTPRAAEASPSPPPVRQALPARRDRSIVTIPTGGRL